MVGDAWVHAVRSDERELLVAALSAFGYHCRPLVAQGFAVLDGNDPPLQAGAASAGEYGRAGDRVPALVAVAIERDREPSERLVRTATRAQAAGAAVVAVADPTSESRLALACDELVVRPYGLAELELRIARALRAAKHRAGVSTSETEDGAGSIGRATGPGGGNTLRWGSVELDLAARRCSVEGREVALTRLEFDLLAHLVANSRRVHSRAGLLLAVWGCQEPAGERAVDVCVQRLRRKLGPAGRHLIETVRGVGYRVAPAGPSRAAHTVASAAMLGTRPTAKERRR
ncbi:winged helix-turn-helix domain-containing protein [Thermoleophilum album]|jgi:DNA-binding response OmpR family regulator|uniref:winged helix-turn-helix domain-containing protein n=1 Tax=Thermoleophilum album TaxID=29539 RepID=UPI00237C5705|nr:response regulator transcription factor [Thermoleophilum album]